MAADLRTAYRTCPLCEATCGLEVTMRGSEVVRIRGDREDVFSHGFICPKGSTLKQLHEDPDRLRGPVVRRDGRFEPVTWEEAFEEIERRLLPVMEHHGRNAVAIYIGNPTAHNLSAMLYTRPLIQALGTEYRYSASTVDQMPKHVSSGLMFGTGISVPVPDIDRTDYLLMLGANPWESNGSLATAPDMPGRLKAVRGRGGRMVVVDPRRTRTADEADEHLAIRPGTDALFLFALAATLFDENLVELGPLSSHTVGLDAVAELARPFTAEAVAADCGIDAEVIRRIARELAGASTAAVYGRIGTCTQEFGTLASWLVDVLNVLTGNLDRPGGAMFSKPVAGSPNTEGRPGVGRGFRVGGSRRTRVRGLPSVLGEFPAATMAEEIQGDGKGGDRLRALITVAGNPVLSLPNGAHLDAALGSLDFMVSVDIYQNETTRHADVILPPPSQLARSHYDVLLYRLAIRNVANYSPPVLDREPGELDEWEILLKLSAIAAGQGAGADTAAVDDAIFESLVAHEVRSETSPLHGQDAAELFASLSRDGSRRGPERMVDLMLRSGPFSDTGVTLDKLIENPHGIDFGPLEQRVPEVLRTPSGKIELAPEPLVADTARLRAAIGRFSGHAATGGLTLVGRRDLRSNNSWMHNVEVLVKGKERCTLHVHPDDAARLGLVDGGMARVTSRAGEVEIVTQVTPAVRPGVVSIPHGWGHNLPGVATKVAEAHAGVNINLLTDDEMVDPLSGNAVLSGTPVQVAAV